MWYNNNESNNWESNHSTYFALQSILFEHLELLEHRATSSAGKTMFSILCSIIKLLAEKNVVLSGCQCLFYFDFGSESPKTCDAC